MKSPVTYLFVPGNRPERFAKALASGADAVILDLEDAVSPDDKEAAREHLARWLEAQPEARERVLVRINDSKTPWFAADVELLRRARVAVAMLPKAESAGQVDAVRAALAPTGQVLPLIETARGVSDAASIASAVGVQRLAFGTLDYAVDLDLSGDERGLLYPAATIALASRCAGIASLIAGVTATIDDDERLRRRRFRTRARIRGEAVHPSAASGCREQRTAANESRDRLGQACPRGSGDGRWGRTSRRPDGRPSCATQGEGDSKSRLSCTRHGTRGTHVPTASRLSCGQATRTVVIPRAVTRSDRVALPSRRTQEFAHLRLRI